MKKGQVKQIIQVCWDLNADNEEREIKGIDEALTFFNRNEGIIITVNQKDIIRLGKHVIHVVPAYEYLTGNMPF